MSADQTTDLTPTELRLFHALVTDKATPLTRGTFRREAWRRLFCGTPAAWALTDEGQKLAQEIGRDT